MPGGKSQHYQLTTDRGQWVVRRSYRSKSVEAVAFEHELMAHLRGRGYPAAAPVATVDGAAAVVLDGRVHSVTSFVADSPYRLGNTAHLKAVAGALATYHALVESFAPRAPIPSGVRIHDSLRARLTELPGPEALPVLLRAKRLKRALGRFSRLGQGEALSVGDLRKIALELDRLRSLEACREVLEPALRGA